MAVDQEGVEAGREYWEDQKVIASPRKELIHSVTEDTQFLEVGGLDGNIDRRYRVELHFKKPPTGMALSVRYNNQGSTSYFYQYFAMVGTALSGTRDVSGVTAHQLLTIPADYEINGYLDILFPEEGTFAHIKSTTWRYLPASPAATMAAVTRYSVVALTEKLETLNFFTGAGNLIRQGSQIRIVKG